MALIIFPSRYPDPRYTSYGFETRITLQGAYLEDWRGICFAKFAPLEFLRRQPQLHPLKHYEGPEDPTSAVPAIDCICVFQEPSDWAEAIQVGDWFWFATPYFFPPTI